MRLAAALPLLLAASLASAAPAPPASKRPAKAAPAKPAAPAPTSPAPSGPGGLEFPTNEAGGRASAWFEAFNAGDAAMKRYLKAHVTPGALVKRSVEDRMDVYRDMKDERGKVSALEVHEFTESSVKVIARGERGGRFAITFLCEEGAPHRLIGIRVEDLPPEEGTPEGADDGGYSRGAPAPQGAPAPAGPRWSDARVAAALRSHLDSLSRAGSFSGAVLLAKGDRVLLRQAYGLASRRYGVPNRPDTKFALGSINKAFTKLVVEQLAREGKLGLDDTVDRWLPDYPPASRITVRMLLDHRGGVPDIFGPRYETADRTRLREVSDWVALIRDQPLRFEPGTREEYSNGGYVLLGAIVEKVTGRSYYDVVRDRIFAPAGMKDTDSYETDDPVRNVASGYTRQLGTASDGPWRENLTSRPGRGSPAGGGYSTVDDLYRFAKALRAGKLGGGDARGIGIAGGAPGMNALLAMEDGWTLVVLANLDPPAAERVGLKARGWLRRAMPRRAEVPDGSPEGGAERRISGRGAALEIGGGGGRRVIEVRGGDRPESTSLPEAGVDVPMEWAGHLASVSVRLNGKGPYRFAIDTGAAGAARVDSAVARELGLPVVGEARVGDPSGKNARSAPVVRMESLEIGGARFTGVTGTVGSYAGRIPGEKVDGILGFSLFADCLFTLDFPGLRMSIASGELPAENGADVIPFRSERGIPSVTLRVAGLDVEADVDAGAMGGISLPDALASKLPLAEPPRVVGRARTVGNEFEIKAAQLSGNVVLGGYTLERPRVDFQPLFPMANVGSRVLRDFAVTFDQKNHRLRLARSA